jgi:catechol 2,3-dioxygenase-like lactoylglutathione lyase family enzyme
MPFAPHAILESSLYVTDLDRAVAFYRDVLGLRPINDGYFEGGRGAAFQVGSGSSVLLLFRAEITRLGGILRIEPAEMEIWRQRLRDHGVAIEKEFAFGDNPPSIYFRDPHGNSLELAVSSIWALQTS